ncbi:hypothetical protein BGZ52_010702 [Haplosporangium bisporale]|nr:hypothetical protein BGZ52_010702 [Haplosporangium bisporale]KAF9217349.1 hypothetical protein BGZ59_004879 [Podila verticillata]KFH65954.1 hypothetical protein MVEG_08056 [Podila verticillata NRRL 6337]
MKLFTIAAFLAPLAALVAADGTITIQATKKGQLYVKLNRATKLTDKDLFGKSDPFIEMWLEKAYKQRSKDTKGLNPIFDQTFCFYVRPGQNKLYIRAVDKDTFRNDKIGDATIPLDNVINTGREGPKDYPLPKWLGFSSNGNVNMQLQFVEDTSA